MAADIIPRRYRVWNRVLLEHLLLADTVEGAVLLTVTPRILSIALFDVVEEWLGPPDAEEDLVKATREVYRDIVLTNPAKLDALLRRIDGVPACIPFLAVSVLAAYHMRTADDHTGRAYYPRLAELLDVNIVGPSYPLGFEGSSFERLWVDLAEWLQTEYGRRLGPPLDSEARPYVAYPLAHAPLRRVDIDRLPRFFSSFGYEPGSRPPLDKLKYDLVTGHGAWTGFTPAGRRALHDEGLRAFVVRQVAHELEHWDGCRKDSAGRRVATIEVVMDVHQRRAHVAWLGRRPAGFPEVLEAESYLFESEEDSWYEPIPLGPEDGEALLEGLRLVSDDGRCVLQRPGTAIMPLCPSEEYTGYLSDRVLRYGSSCAVLCSERLAAEAAQYLRSITSKECSARRDPTLPSGWCLFLDVTPTRSVDPPPDLEHLRVESSVKVVPHGGLRLGGRWAWLQGAPPHLELIGRLDDQPIRLNGRDTTLDKGNRLSTAWFDEAGQYVLEIGTRLRQKINIIEPAVHPDCGEWPPTTTLDRLAIVPAGDWVIVGVLPGELLRLPRSSGATLVAPPFDCSWAVSVGAGPGARVRHLQGAAVGGEIPGRIFLPRAKQPRQRWLQWAELIYQAAIRRPELTAASNLEGCSLEEAWRDLTLRARAVKKANRRSR